MSKFTVPQVLKLVGGGIRRGKGVDEWWVRCTHPDHEDVNPSMGVSVGKDEKAVINCISFNEKEHNKGALQGLSDLQRAVDVTYKYRDSEGRVFRTKRKYYKSGRRQMPQSYVGKPDNTMPYRYDEMEKARLSGCERCYVLEGEGDCDAMWAEGYVATTVGAAGSWGDESSEYLAEWPEIVVIADKDAPGIKGAKAAVESLRRVCSSSKVGAFVSGIDIANDMGDHLVLGGVVSTSNDEGLIRLSDYVLRDVKASESLEERVGKLVDLRNMKAERVRWLWADKLPIGMFSLLAGREGIGKSTLGVDIIAQITRGELPGEFYGIPRDVIYIHGNEDTLKNVILPRLIAAGADLSRVHPYYTKVKGRRVRTVFPMDLEMLKETIKSVNPVLLFIDPATSTIDSRLSGNSDREMREALEPIAQLAEDLNCAVLGVVHFGKGDKEDILKLIMGTSAWSQVSRSVLAVAENADKHIVLSIGKSNNAAKHGHSLEAEIVECRLGAEHDHANVSKVRWLGETNQHVTDLINGGSRKEKPRDSCAEWLRETLATRVMSASEVRRKAREEGYKFSAMTFTRAAREVGVVQRRTSDFPSTTLWSLPGDEKNNCANTYNGATGVSDCDSASDVQKRSHTIHTPNSHTRDNHSHTRDTLTPHSHQYPGATTNGASDLRKEDIQTHSHQEEEVYTRLGGRARGNGHRVKARTLDFTKLKQWTP